MLRPVSGGVLLLPPGAEVLRQIEGYVLDGMDLDPVSVLSEAGCELAAVATLLAGEVQSYRHLPLRIATSWAGWGSCAGGEGGLSALTWRLPVHPPNPPALMPS